jgi:hypothetical protein
MLNCSCMWSGKSEVTSVSPPPWRADRAELAHTTYTRVECPMLLYVCWKLASDGHQKRTCRTCMCICGSHALHPSASFVVDRSLSPSPWKISYPPVRPVESIFCTLSSQAMQVCMHIAIFCTLSSQTWIIYYTTYARIYTQEICTISASTEEIEWRIYMYDGCTHAYAFLSICLCEYMNGPCCHAWGGL